MRCCISLLKFVPLGVFIGMATVLMSIVMKNSTTESRVASAIIDVYLICRAINIMSGFFLAPHAKGLRLLQMRDEYAGYTFRRLRNIVVTAGIGIAIANGFEPLGLSDAVRIAILKIMTLDIRPRRLGLARQPRSVARDQGAWPLARLSRSALQSRRCLRAHDRHGLHQRRRLADGAYVLGPLRSASHVFPARISLFAGIAGIDPAQGTLGSAAWAKYMVDFGIQWELDAREKPADWPSGFTGINTKGPTEKPPLDYRTEVFALNATLADAQVARAKFNYAPANKPPSVIQCDTLAGDTWWSGKYNGERARDWTKLLTDGRAFIARRSRKTMRSTRRLSAQRARAGWICRGSRCYAQVWISIVRTKGRPHRTIF